MLIPAFPFRICCISFCLIAYLSVLTSECRFEANILQFVALARASNGRGEGSSL
ncbi:hypothetical protein LX32DRAFT_639175, partial [Colletotrichum zoysiae]